MTDTVQPSSGQLAELVPVGSNSGYLVGNKLYFRTAGGILVEAGATNPFPVTGGGGGGGTSDLLEGAALTGEVLPSGSHAFGWLSWIRQGIGALGDAAWGGTGNGSQIAILKALYTRLRGGQATMANSLPVVLPSDQTVAVDNAVSAALGDAVASNGALTKTAAGTNSSAPLAILGYFFNGTTWDRLRGDATNGLKAYLSQALPAGTNILGKVGIDTAANTVQANAGTNLNTSLLALESGGNLAGILASLGASADAIVAAGAAGSTSAKLRRVTQGLEDLKSQIILAAGSAVIGQVTANAGTNLNTSALALETGGNLAALATVFGAVNDAIVAAGAAGSASAKLRRATQGLEDLKTQIVLAAGTNIIGKVGIDPANNVVQANAGTNLNTSLLALESGGNLASLLASAGAAADAIVAAGAAGSLSAKLRRTTQGLEDLKTLIVLAAGTNIIGRVGIDQTTPGTTNGVSQNATQSPATTLQNAATATGNGTTIPVTGHGSVALTVSGTFVATITWEGTEDGTNWNPVTPMSFASTSLSSTATAPGLFVLPVGGLTGVRARISAYTSGSVTVTGHAAPLTTPQRVMVSAKGPKTLTSPTIANTSTLALAANPLRKLAIITNPSATVTVYIGLSGVTTASYVVALPPGSPTYIDGDSNDAWYAVVPSGTLAINVTEIV